MNCPLVSVVIPVYNSEIYLNKTLVSIIRQTYKELEIILVNDGSTDNSLSVCENFAKIDKRIKIFNNTNHGPSYSRNYGISKACGKYLVFIDSDDYVDSDFIEKMVTSAEYDQKELVLCNITLEFYTGERVVAQKAVCNIDSGELTYNYFADLWKIYDLTIGPVVKLLRLDIIKEHSIIFPENIKFSEDRMLMVQYAEYVRSYGYVDSPMYHYCFRDNFSLSKSRSKKSFDDAIAVLNEEVKYLNNADADTRNRIVTYNILTYAKMFVQCSDDGDNYDNYKIRIDALMDLARKNSISLKSRNIFCVFCLNHGLYIALYNFYSIRNGIKKIVFAIRA